MKNLIDRISELEEIARRWNLDKKVYTSFDQYNNQVTESKFTQKTGLKRGETLTFETPSQALDFILEQLEEDPQVQAQILVDDIRDILPDEDCVIFLLLFPDPPDLRTFFDLRNGQDVATEAVRMWRRSLSGVKYLEWWEKTNAHIDELTQWAQEELLQDDIE